MDFKGITNTMKLPLLTATALSIAVSSSFVHADSSRYVIKLDNAHKAVIKALAKRMGGELKIDANGFITAKFRGHNLAQVRALFSNQSGIQIEEDPKRFPLSEYSDDLGDPNVQQITPYSYYQSEADQVSFDPNAGIKVCVIDSGLDRGNPDFNWNNITGTNDSGTGNWDYDRNSHGTHVAGTIGAQDNGIGVIGMAPGVDMHIIKVFNEDGWGYSSDLAYAAQKCTDAGANIINMSLGGGGANTAEENAFDAFTEAGGLVLAAAGNDGNDARSYPAGYSSVMMVGGNGADNQKYEASQFPACTNVTATDCVEISAGGLNVLSTEPGGLGLLSNLSMDGVDFKSSAMENKGSTMGSTYFMGTAEATDSSASGKICVIDRGNVSFYDKVRNCEDSGGIGAIVINNTDGMLYGTLGDTNDTTIPAVGAAFEDRASILASSSASIALESGDYGYKSGTSMATPAVSGIAALVWSNHPECTGTQVREALKATAFDAGTPGRDVDFGYGIAKAKAAHDYLTENGCDDVIIEPDNKLQNGVAVTNLTAGQGGELFFTLDVPASASNLSFVTSGGSGDADLHVKFGEPVSANNYDYRPYENGNAETVSIPTPQAGTYYVMLRGYRAFSGVSLVANFDESGPSETFTNDNNVSIPDNNSAGGVSNISVTRSGDAGTVSVDVNIQHTWRGDLTVQLVAPSGVSKTIWTSSSNDSADNIVDTISVNMSGEESSGTWGLKVVDSARQDTGYINSWSITF